MSWSEGGSIGGMRRTREGGGEDKGVEFEGEGAFWLEKGRDGAMRVRRKWEGDWGLGGEKDEGNTRDGVAMMEDGSKLCIKERD